MARTAGTSDEPPVRKIRSTPSGVSLALASAWSTAVSIRASSGAIQPSKVDRYTPPNSEKEPASKRNSAASCADRASFSRETER